jgi:hypothetical protein
MKDPFPFNSLSAKQTVIVGELLRDHPEGRLENDNGKPVFVSASGASVVRISLSETNGGSANRNLAREQAR